MFIEVRPVTFAALLLALIPWRAGAQAVPVRPDVVVDLQSANGRTYRLRIQIPAARPRALLLVLDGHSHFRATAEIARMLAPETGPIAVAGLELVSEIPIDDARTFDFTTPVPEAHLPSRLRERRIAVGGVADFVRFLIADALPRIQRALPEPIRCRTLFGHSLAGLASLEVLQRAPRSFESYVASSPSLWWDDRRTMRFLPRKRAASDVPRLLLTVGGDEQTVPKNVRASDPERAARIDRFAMVDNAALLARALGKPGSPTRTTFQVFPGETHESVVPAALSRALRFAAQCAEEPAPAR